MKSRKIVFLVSFVALLLLFNSSPFANAAYDTFSAVVDESGAVISTGSYPNTGHEQGTWYEYPSGWWNEWFYNAPFDPTRWKIIDVGFTLTPSFQDGGQIPSWAVVTINWATPEWSALQNGRPPLPVDVVELPWLEDKYIARAPALFADELVDVGPAGIYIEDHLEILPFNPEWVSIDIKGQNFQIEGWIEHVCVPIPSTLLLLGSGVFGLALWRRRRT